MQGHRLLRAVAVLILIVALVYLLLAVGGALWLGGRGFGAGWGTGWTGWLVLPLAGAAVMGGLTLMVFGLMLFFLAVIDNNLNAARQQPRVKPKTQVGPAPAVQPPAATPVAPPPPYAPSASAGAPAPTATPGAAAAVTLAPLVAPEPAPPVEPPLLAPAEELPPVEADELSLAPAAPPVLEAPSGESVAVQTEVEAPRVGAPVTVEPIDDSSPRVVFGEPVGEVLLPAVLPSIEIVDEGRAPADELVTVEEAAVVDQAPVAEVQLPRVEAAAPELVLPEIEPSAEEVAPENVLPPLERSEEVVLETPAALPQVELTEVAVVEPEVRAPETVFAGPPAVELPRVDVGVVEPDLEAADMVTPQADAVAPDVEAPVERVSELALEAPAVPSLVEFASEPRVEAPAPDDWLPQVEISEVSGPEPEFDKAVAALSEATGVPESEQVNIAPAEPMVERPTTRLSEEELLATAVEPASDLAAMQAEIMTLRAQLAALQAQLKPGAEPPAPASTLPPEPADLAQELPADAPVDAGSGLSESGAARLPGADEVARIAAEMAAIKGKRTRPAPAEPPSPAATARAPQIHAGEDNLEIIMGVGPIYAKRLRELGITTYAQLAEASYEVLEKVTRGNLERVVKEDWCGQARRLMNRS
jgi:predicted flap endonuclease-1-like 5' DNA nuclease